MSHPYAREGNEQQQEPAISLPLARLSLRLQRFKRRVVLYYYCYYYYYYYPAAGRFTVCSPILSEQEVSRVQRRRVPP